MEFQKQDGRYRLDRINKDSTKVRNYIQVPVGENRNGMSNERERASRKVGLKCFYANARSLRNKKDELLSYIVEENLDVDCIMEAWVNEEKFRDSRKEYEVDRYIMRAGRIGGRVVIHAKKFLHF